MIRLHNFVLGDLSEVARIAEQFDQLPAWHRYVLLHGAGEGRVLVKPPVWRKAGNCVEIEAPVAPPGKRPNVWALREIDIDTMTSVRGLEAALAQIRFRLTLREGDVGSENGGNRIRRLCEHLGVERLSQFLKLELIRLSSVPIGNDGSAPLDFVERVVSVAVHHDEAVRRASALVLREP